MCKQYTNSEWQVCMAKYFSRLHMTFGGVMSKINKDKNEMLDT